MEENKFSVSGKTQKGWMTFCWLFAESITTLEMIFQGIFQPPKGSNMELKVMSVNSHPSFETFISIVVNKFLNVKNNLCHEDIYGSSVWVGKEEYRINS